LNTTEAQARITNRQWLVAVYAAIITFLTYATVYGFRKTYSVGTFDNMTVFGIGYKETLVIMQALGYLSSKFYGIRFIAELKRFGRWKIIFLLVGISWIAWLFFAVVPSPYNIIFLFLNGFPLGLIWGIVFSYIEGRRATDLIGAAMAVSFIFSSGFVKSVGNYLMVKGGIQEIWMPFVAGAIFVPFLVLFVFLLEKIPAPLPEDIETRTERIPMSKEQRRKIIHRFFPGIVLLVVLYVFLTIFRDIRDNFISNMWKEMGYFGQPELFTQTEIPITLAVLVLIGSMIAIKNNFRALMVSHIIVLAGFILAGTSTVLFINGMLSPVYWVTLVGMGLYMGYIPYNCVLFERLIAAFRLHANVGFLIYIADSFGYLGSVAVIITKGVFNLSVQWTKFYSNSVIFLSVIGVIGTLISILYFKKKHKELVLNNG
jgi:MFS family permease